jgi:hypothetical protein
MQKLDHHIDISILEKAKILQIITDYLKKYTNFQIISYACNLDKNILIIGCTNSSNLNLIRNYQYEIIKDINCEFSKSLEQEIKKIKFKIIKNPVV